MTKSKNETLQKICDHELILNKQLNEIHAKCFNLNFSNLIDQLIYYDHDEIQKNAKKTDFLV